ncbi:integrase, catalytic region, zinc finger, CCHC-type containing protein, partial [Tanacetum coccineum]
NVRDDNKRTRTGNAFAITANPVRGGYIGYFAKDCRVALRNVNPVNVKNPIARTCYECGSSDHIKSACPRLNQAQRPVGNPHNQVVAVNGGQAKNANPLALVSTAQTLEDPYYQSSKSHKSYAPTSKSLIPSRSYATTRNKGKEIAKPITPPSETSSNTRNKNVDSTPRYREIVGGPVVQQSGIQCFNCKEFGYYAKECKKLKQVKDSTYHKEKMLLCKQAEKAHYSYMAKIQEVPNADSGTNAEPLEQVQYDTGDNVFANDIQHFDQSESISNTCAVETGDSNVTHDSPDMYDNDIQDDQNDVECDDERVALANLIANLKLDVDKNKKDSKSIKEIKCNIDSRIN